MGAVHLPSLCTKKTDEDVPFVRCRSCARRSQARGNNMQSMYESPCKDTTSQRRTPVSRSTDNVQQLPNASVHDGDNGNGGSSSGGSSNNAAGSSSATLMARCNSASIDSSSKADDDELKTAKQPSSLRGGSSKLLVMVCTNIANLCCHSVYSVLASFFPQEAKAKGMSDEGVGLVFAIFAAVIFVCSPFAGRLMSRHGKVWVYIWGIGIVSVASMLFALAAQMPAGIPFAAFCVAMRLLQGFGSALEETAMYAIIAELDTEHVTFNLGICEISTGLGYMIGPPLGGFLFSYGGFAMPFVALGLMVVPAALLLYHFLPPDELLKGAKDEAKADIPIRALLRNPQVMVIAVAAMLANSDYAFLEPTLGDHAAMHGLASTPDGIGMLFSVAMTTYTLSCPAIGVLAKRERLGPRVVILCGLLLQLLGFVLIGPSPLLPLNDGSLRMPQMVVALVVLGVGESMSMTPVMDDMMFSCGEYADDALNALSSLMASAFSLGQMIGPLIGSGLTARMGFANAGSLMAVGLLGHVGVIMLADVYYPRARTRHGPVYMELKTAGTPMGAYTPGGGPPSEGVTVSV